MNGTATVNGITNGAVKPSSFNPFHKVDPNARFEKFDRVDLPFRILDEKYTLYTTVLTPKQLASNPDGQYPVMVHWHGGGFLVGHRMYEGWSAIWLLEFALSKNSIIISPDYRLMPESSGVEIMSDVSAFWEWLHGTLPGIARREGWHAQPDLEKIMCCGESSGGYIAVQSTLCFPGNACAKIRAIISSGAPLNFDVPGLKVPRPRILMGSRPPPPREAERTIREYLKQMKREPGRIRTGCDPGGEGGMWEFALCVFQQSYLPRFFGVKGNPELDDMAGLEKVVDKKLMPPVWVVHGEQDSMCPPICATGFVEKWKECLAEVPVLLSLRKGDHMFDVLEGMESEWIREGVEFVERFWP